ncbi:glycosyltransferase family 2 protein [Fructilactobacillus carniphilus]|uniref:Glycosyltransferase family 2 protein n=1 Tax=Fructilactobacillus carniphilus TaxID=2940297 RepID=A0ABY5BV06_9LACO|nr:glycosyltransferase family 2 protein [Fructilactobacillus carniphilus]USS90336.1 glycosyltransferase family 2 protein [Fructilactobacillus carniphilus]
MTKDTDVAGVLVTFNRLELLKGSIRSLLEQTVAVKNLFIINNASSDGTKEYLDNLKNEYPQIKIKNLDKNIGGAGGFNEGIKFAAQNGNYDFYWVMDDDTYPKKDALEQLLNADEKLINQKENVGFLSSNVIFTDGNPVKMNIPVVSPEWNKDISENLVGLSSASFVSMLINNDAVEKLGLPISEFFIWGDDVEYSERISSHYSCYFVGHSEVVHKMKANAGVNLLTENKNRIGRHFYDTRNRFYMAKQRGLKTTIKYFLNRVFMIFEILFSRSSDKFKKNGVLIHGLWSGIWFSPKIEYLDKKLDKGVENDR